MPFLAIGFGACQSVCHLRRVRVARAVRDENAAHPVAQIVQGYDQVIHVVALSPIGSGSFAGENRRAAP